MLVHRRVTPSIKFAGTHLYTWVERGTVRLKCLVQEHNTMSPAKARTGTARSGNERTNHEVPAPPTTFNVRESLNVAHKIKSNSLKLSFKLFFFFYICLILVFFDRGDMVASWLVRSTPDRAVWVRALAGDIVLCSWARYLILTVSLKCVPVNLV